MGVVVNTNISSLSAARILAKNRDGLEQAMTRLSSGKRINSASDDAAGMAVAAKLRADVRSLNQSVRNANDGISLVATYDGAAAEVETILVRMRELAVQAANSTYTAADKVNGQKEITALIAEVERIADNTKFNRQVIADGTGTFNFRVGAQSGTADNVSITLGDIETASGALDIASVDISSNATAAMTSVDTAIDTIAGYRANAGGFLSRLGVVVSVQMNVSQRMSEALSGVEDADYAIESANLARGMVLAQAGAAMLAQANRSPEYILTLLSS